MEVVSHGLGIVLVAGTAGGRWFSQHSIDRDWFIQYVAENLIAGLKFVGVVYEKQGHRDVSVAKWLYYKIL